MTDDGVRVGEKIRETRKARRLTLQRVADATGLSIGFLSQVERDITTPSLASLMTIARALDVPANAFLHPAAIPSGVTRRGARAAYAPHPDWISYERLSSDTVGQSFGAVKMTIPPNHLSETARHEGEEIVYVLSGTLRYVIEGAIYELNQGNSLHFSAQRPHRVHNPTDQPAEAISVGTRQLLGDPAAPGGGGTLEAGPDKPAEPVRKRAGETI